MVAGVAGCVAIHDVMRCIRRHGPLPPMGADLPCPIRIAWGTRDRALPFARFGQPLLDRVPPAELVRLPGVGHVPMYDDPELVPRTILDLSQAVDRMNDKEEQQ